jgi:hypothetical protein
MFTLAAPIALEANPNPLDADMKDIDPAPTSLDLPEEQPYRRSGKVPIRVAVSNDGNSGNVIE